MIVVEKRTWGMRFGALFVVLVMFLFKRARSVDTAPRRSSVTIANFYLNRIASTPDGDLIDVMHKEWYGKYRRLEDHHGFIQWLFPTRTYSMFNDLAPRLTDDDIDTMKVDVEVGRRIIRSYKMMLDFYGMRLVNEETGELERSPHFRERYRETLETRSHNHLRVCRILSCFSVLGFRRYKTHLVGFLEAESGFVNGAVRRAAGSSGWPLKITPNAIKMFRTYVQEDTPEYVKYTEVKLPRDHSDHVIFAEKPGPGGYTGTTHVPTAPALPAGSDAPDGSKDNEDAVKEEKPEATVEGTSAVEATSVSGGATSGVAVSEYGSGLVSKADVEVDIGYPIDAYLRPSSTVDMGFPDGREPGDADTAPYDGETPNARLQEPHSPRDTVEDGDESVSAGAEDKPRHSYTV